jgi:glycine oxidase
VDPSTRLDAVVVGAGVIGLACAWRAAGRGLRVAAVDPAPGHGASHVAAGMLAPVSELHYGEESLLRLNLAAVERYPSFVAELESASGESAGYRECGTLAVALDAGDRAVLEDLHRFQSRLGLDARPLSGRECRRLEPLLAPRAQAGLLIVGDHQVDNRRLASALLTAAARSGATVVRHRVAEVCVDDGSVSGVLLDDGTRIRARTVVLAAGARTGQIGGVPAEVLPPVRPVKGQILRLRVPPAYRPFLSRTVRGTVRGCQVYLVPRADGEVVVGATQEELGYDELVTAGGVYQLLRDAHTLVPGITELHLAETSAGLRPGSPDNAPIVGPTSLPGLVLATGHYRNGILLTPVTADAVATVLAEGSLPEPMRAFSPRRFTLEGAAPGGAGR